MSRRGLFASQFATLVFFPREGELAVYLQILLSASVSFRLDRGVPRTASADAKSVRQARAGQIAGEWKGKMMPDLLGLFRFRSLPSFLLPGPLCKV